MFTARTALGTVAAATLVSAATLGVLYGVTARTAPPVPAQDTTALQTALTRAETAETALSEAQTALDAADRDARYTACMYALNTLEPRGDMAMAQWSCTRNADDFGTLRFGRAWDAREYGE